MIHEPELVSLPTRADRYLALLVQQRERMTETKGLVLAACDAGLPIKLIAETVGIGRATIYRWLKER